ncbi:MAG TPA: hypothetical protein PKJ83_15145 [Cyclobacteriaceae bacterium]|nr:hypothetical protein [Cyclobacteriaceae bacterium]
MKKIIYAIILVATTFTVVTSCTEEEVKPQTESGGNAGGSPIKE